MGLGVDEASATYERAMRNMASPGDGVCPVCWTFKDPTFPLCYPCSQKHPNLLDVVVPITYAEEGGQMHTALRN